ncbi:MAG TPA: hypothetical protein GXX75_16570 [Clostridiales bacterium]|nr:hypothetical protein [Clostridiales bacterium]
MALQGKELREAIKNTLETMKTGTFAVNNPSKIDTNFEEQIRDRLMTGFENWNKGYDVWEEWCNTLYEPDAYYNVHGKRMTLTEYKASMKQIMAAVDIQMGDFENIIIRDDWCSIRYSITTRNLQTGEISNAQTMEFVHFKDNGGDIGARVIEGWAQ